MDNNSVKYPVPSDLASVIKDYIPRAILMDFLHRKGLFYFHIRQDKLAELASHILYDNPSLDELRRMAHNLSNKSILTGFTLSSDKEFSFDSIYNTVRNEGTLGGNYSLKAIGKIQSKSGEEVYQGRIIYVSKKAGRIEFIKEEKHDVSFIATKKDNKTWLIEVDGSKSGDGKEVQKMIQRIVKNQNINVNTLSLEKLEGEKPNIFFDHLAQKGMGGDWQIKDITRITIRKRLNENDVDEEDEDNAEAEVEDEHLSGIRQAILEGKNLRENKFVKASEDQGYIFSSMTYDFIHNKDQKEIKIRAEFKGNPKIFEVVLEDVIETFPSSTTKDPKETTVRSKLSALSDKDNFKVRSTFWNNAKAIYAEVSQMKEGDSNK